MGFKKKFKKAKKTVTKAASTVKQVANTPIVRTAVTTAATALGGPQAGMAVNQAYDVMNNASGKDLLIGAVAGGGYLNAKSQINKLKDQYSSFSAKDQYSSLSVLVPKSNKIDSSSSLNVLNSGVTPSSKITTPKKRSFIGEILAFFGF